MNPDGSVLVEAEGLLYQYPNSSAPAIDGVDLRLVAGEAIGLLGPNGAGKSTLIDLLIGLRHPSRGAIRRRAKPPPTIAWVPQEYALYPALECGENLRLFADMLDIDRREATRRIEAAIETCRLGEFIDRQAQRCSGGVRRRLNLAIALLAQPDVLLLDEPTAGVDPQSRAFLLDRVRELVRDGTAVLYASHYMEEVSDVCSRILLLDHGRVLASGELDALLASAGDGEPHADLEALFMHYTSRSLRD